MCCMPDIGIRELGWMTSRGCGKVGKVFFMKSGDSRSVYTSRKRDGRADLPSRSIERIWDCIAGDITFMMGR